jgi:hypothetical protein
MRLSEKHRIARSIMNAQQTTIIAKFVNPIKAGGKFGSIKDSTDNMWWTSDPTILSTIQKGQQITLSYNPQTWGKGTDAKRVNVIEEVLDEAPRTQGTQAPQIVTDKDTRIFVCGFLQHLFQGTGKFPGAQELQTIIYATRCAYETAFGRRVQIITPRGAQAPQAAAEMDEEIPF